MVEPSFNQGSAFRRLGVSGPKARSTGQDPAARAELDLPRDVQIAAFQRELVGMGYRFQFVTLAGFHALNASMFELAHGYANEGMSAYGAAPGTRAGARAARLLGDQTPVRGRHRVLRPRLRDRERRPLLDARARGREERAQFDGRERESV